MHYQNEPNFNCVYSKNNLPKIKDGANVINLDEYKSIETHWIVLYVEELNILRQKLKISEETKIL